MKSTHLAFIVYFLLSILLISYAYERDIEFDEAWTYSAIIHSSAKDILLYTKCKFANNHILNSLYFKLLWTLQLKANILYRMISIISYGLFTYACVRIGKRYNIKFSYLPLLFIAPYFIYFGLGRGYGFALACYALSLAFLLDFLETKSKQQFLFIILWGTLSSLAVFSFLYGYLVIIAIAYLHNFKKLSLFYHSLTIISTIALLAYIHYAGSIINASDPYIIGSHRLLKNGSMSSVFSDLTWHGYLWQIKNYRLFKLITLLSFFAIIVISSKKMWLDFKSRGYNSELIILIAVTVAPFLIMFAANLLLDAKMPMGRALFYVQFTFLLLIVRLVSQQKAVYNILLVPLIAISLGGITAAFAKDIKNTGVAELVNKHNPPMLYAAFNNPNVWVIFELNGYDPTHLKYTTVKELNNISYNTLQGSYLYTQPDSVKQLTIQPLFVEHLREGLSLYRYK